MNTELTPRNASTADFLLENSHLFNIEGWWEATLNGEHRQFVRIRLDSEKQKYLLDVVGQRCSDSEELWRYKGGDWMFTSSGNINLSP